MGGAVVLCTRTVCGADGAQACRTPRHVPPSLRAEAPAIADQLAALALCCTPDPAAAAAARYDWENEAVSDEESPEVPGMPPLSSAFSFRSSADAQPEPEPVLSRTPSPPPIDLRSMRWSERKLLAYAERESLRTLLREQRAREAAAGLAAPGKDGGRKRKPAHAVVRNTSVAGVAPAEMAGVKSEVSLTEEKRMRMRTDVDEA
jgi:hypothetical protein